jgi:hypothetical protein
LDLQGLVAKYDTVSALSGCGGARRSYPCLFDERACVSNMRFSCRSCDHPIESAPDSTLAVFTSAHVSGKLVNSWHHDGSFRETDLSSSRSRTADPERHSLDHPGKQAKSTRAEALPCLSPHPPRLTVWLCSALFHASDCWQSYFFAFLARPCHLPS